MGVILFCIAHIKMQFQNQEISMKFLIAVIFASKSCSLGDPQWTLENVVN